MGFGVWGLGFGVWGLGGGGFDLKVLLANYFGFFLLEKGNRGQFWEQAFGSTPMSKGGGVKLWPLISGFKLQVSGLGARVCGYLRLQHFSKGLSGAGVPLAGTVLPFFLGFGFRV